jgi:hypothetical protein
MSLEDFITEIESAAQKYALKMDIVAKTKNAIKFNVPSVIRLRSSVSTTNPQKPQILS